MAAGAERFRRTDEVLRALIESPPHAVIFALDRQYRYLAYNQNHARTMQRIWGAQVAVGVDILGLIARDDDRRKARANFDRALAGQSFTLIEEYGDAGSARRICEDQYSPVYGEAGEIVGLSVCLRDVTEQRRAELERELHLGRLEAVVEERGAELEAAHAQLLHAQKLETLGMMAGGLAHDFNNLLAIMLARAELYLREAPDGVAGSEHIAIIRDAAFEARALTKQLLGNAGKGTPSVEPLSLTGIVQNMAHLLRASIGKDVRLELEPCAEMVAVQGDDTQLRQVLLNLVTNAAEAIGSDVGRVVIRTGVTEITDAMPERRWFAGELASGRYAYLEVEDSGSGITAADRERIFAPFFSTKSSGRGLGLAAVLGIVKRHRGTVLVDSRPGVGSRFRILLPAIDAGRMPESVAPERWRASARGNGCVLVVDDEAAVRAATVAILASAGYRVLAVDGGESATRLFRSCSSEIDVVLLDLAMPGMNGEQTLSALRQIRADVPVVLLTAYAEDELRLRAIRDDLAGFVAKPFSYEELLNAVRCAANPTSGYMVRGHVSKELAMLGDPSSAAT